MTELKMSNYEQAHKRFRKRVDGKVFVSTRGLPQDDSGLKKGQKELDHWEMKQIQERARQEERAKHLLAKQRELDDKMLEKFGSFASADPLATQEQFDELFGSQEKYEQWKAEQEKPKPKSRTPKDMATVVDQFIEFKKKKVGEGQIIIYKAHLKTFWLSFTAGERIDTLDREVWNKVDTEITNRMNSGRWSSKYAHDVIVNIRSLYKWAHTDEIIDEIPRFIMSDNYSIEIGQSTPEFFDNAELVNIFSVSDEQEKLWWLLCLNCSMTQGDLSELTWDMIDPEAGTLTRKRGKHAKRKRNSSKKTPTVRYVLWPEVVAKLNKMDQTTERVFSNEVGKPLVQSARNDSVGQKFERMVKPFKIEKTVKHFRKTGTTLMATKYRPWREVYLANSSKEVTDKNYDGTLDLPAEITEHIKAQLPKELFA
jgi:integrase